MAGLFDSHAHLNSEMFSEDVEQVCKRVEESEIEFVMNVAYDLESSVKAIRQAAEYKWCYASVGCHPHDVRLMEESDLSLFKGLAKKPKVKAIGEIGLDFHYDYSPRDVQRHWFRRQIQLALELKLPIIIHDREAHEETMEILKQENAFETKVLLHCYSGSKDMAMQYIKLGAMLSIAGPVTYKNSKKLVEVVQTVPLEKLMIETDAPYLAPEPVRGRRNEPQNVKYVAEKISEITGIDYQQVVDITNSNARSFFGI